MSTSYIKKLIIPILVIILHFSLGAYFAGEQFISNLSTAVPRNAAQGDDAPPKFMLPGDHFEQLYRYSLPRHNLEQGRPLYESGYQYNFSADSSPFSEGWVFFPFSVIHTVLSALSSDIVAYNLLALLSFPLVGGAMYWLVLSLTRSHPSALLSSLLLALLPHRTSFLFGEMVYGIDLMWPPLIVLAFEKAIRTLQRRYAILFGLSLLLYATSNFQGLYLFSVFSFPYFAFRIFQTVKQKSLPEMGKLWLALTMLVSTLPALLYLFFIRNLLTGSGLSNGQSYIETTMYSPTLLNAITVWSGNEKTIYLGWPLFLTLIVLFIFGVTGYIRSAANRLSSPDRGVFALAGLVFFISYLFCFGPNLDSMLNAPIFKSYFYHLPGANGTRTPGRLMSTAGFYFAIFFGFIIHLTVSMVKERKFLRKMIWPITLLTAIGIIYNYNYTKPLLIELDQHNSAYESIRGNSGIVFTVPIQQEAPHYLNTTFLYYAQKYDLRMFVGHSSMYPKEWDQIIGDFLPVNQGRFDRAMMQRFKARGINRLAVHATSFEPNVSSIILARLKQSPYLNLLAQDSGVSIFSINYEASGEQAVDPERLAESAKLGLGDYGKFMYLDGWYAREVYPDEKPFRWMHGLRANGIVFVREKHQTTADFTYFCPRGKMTIFVNKKLVVEEDVELAGGWKKRTVDLNSYGKENFVVDFQTNDIFKAPPDTRDFGCQMGDVDIR